MQVKSESLPEDFKTFLDSIESRIQFTLEIKKDRVLNFAGLGIRRLDNTFVYMHQSNTKLVAMMKTLVHRAYDLCTLEENRKEEMNFSKIRYSQMAAQLKL